MTVRVERKGPVTTVILDRPAVRNAVDRATADALTRAFRDFEADAEAKVGVLWGEHGTFCAGADLKAIASGEANRLDPEGDGPMGPSRMPLDGGLELAMMCDMRVAATDAVFGVYCRRWGVPLIDGGTVRLSRMLGHSHALDLILTGRGVRGDEARIMGLANRLVEPGDARSSAIELGHQLAAFPQVCLRSDRRSSYEQWGLDMSDAMANETTLGLAVIRSGETSAGASRFADGAGRHGAF
jgi:enoyl-CoA hydratase